MSYSKMDGRTRWSAAHSCPARSRTPSRDPPHEDIVTATTASARALRVVRPRRCYRQHALQEVSHGVEAPPRRYRGNGFAFRSGPFVALPVHATDVLCEAFRRPVKVFVDRELLDADVADSRLGRMHR
jgi:hypothetical protein